MNLRVTQNVVQPSASASKISQISVSAVVLTLTDYLSIEGPEYVLRPGDHIVCHALNSGLSSCSRHGTGDLELTVLTSIYEDLSGSQYLHPRDHNLYYSLTKTGGSGSTKYPPPASTTYLAWE